MHNERAIFSITPDAIHSAQEEARIFGSFLTTRKILERLCATHPVLAEYGNEVSSEEVGDEKAYGTGFLTTYAFVSRQLALNGNMPDITRDDIDLHVYNIIDQDIFAEASVELEQISDNISVISADGRMGCFLKRLEISSPELAHLFYDVLFNELDNLTDRKSFLRGAYDAFMPFYNKREAEYMYDHLVWLPALQKAVEAGLYTFDSMAEDDTES